MQAQTEHQFRVSEFMTPEQMAVDYHAQLYNVRARVSGNRLAADSLRLDFLTDSTTAVDLATKGLNVTARSPMHVMKLVDEIQPLLNAVSDSAVITPLTSLQDLTMLDTIRRLIPDIDAAITLRKGSPIQPFIDSTGLDIREVSLMLNSDSLQTDLALEASTPHIEHAEDSTAMRLPPMKASLGIYL